MLDGQLRRAVMFPDDGHSDLAANVLDPTGDARAEIAVWVRAAYGSPVRNPDRIELSHQRFVSGWESVE